MKDIGKTLLRVAEAYPLVTIALATVVITNAVYNVCVLVDRHNYYKEMAKRERPQREYYYEN